VLREAATRYSLGNTAERTARGQRDRGDAIRLSTRTKPSEGARVTGKSPWTDPVLRHRERPRGQQRGEPQVRIELQYARNLASEQTVEVVRNHEDGAWATVGNVVPKGQELRLRFRVRRADARRTEEGRAHPGRSVRCGGSHSSFSRMHERRPGRYEPRGRAGDCNGVGEWW